MRIVTYNIEFGGRGREAAIERVLAGLEADVIALTEADDPAVVAGLADALGLHHVWAEGSGARHLATLSRFPILDWQIHNRPPLSQGVLATKLGVGNGERGSGEVITVYNVHFLPFLLLPFEMRRWQAVGRLLALIREEAPGPHLIVGDVNSIGPGDRVRQRRNPARMRRVMALQAGIVFRLAVPRLLRAGYVDCFRRLHPESDGFTWMTGNPTTRYDYVLADRAMAPRLRACRVVTDAPGVEAASDHYPLLASFSS